MNMAINTFQSMNDHCRFLLLEMGIGVLTRKMDNIIDNILGSFPHLAMPASNHYTEAYNNVVIKALNEIYDNHVIHYAKQSGLSNVEKYQINRIEQFLFMQQLSHRQYLRNASSPLINNFTLRDCLHYFPAFQAKIQCYGVKPPMNHQCVPIHPWFWRNLLKDNYYSDTLPCIHHKKGWNACSDVFYLMDDMGRFLSFYSEQSVDESEELNAIFNRLDLPYQSHYLTTEETYNIPIDKEKSLSVSIISSPFDKINTNLNLIPFNAVNHPLIKNQLSLSYSQIKSMVYKPLEILNDKYKMVMKFNQFNPLIVFYNGNIKEVIYHQAASN